MIDVVEVHCDGYAKDFAIKPPTVGDYILNPPHDWVFQIKAIIHKPNPRGAVKIVRVVSVGKTGPEGSDLEDDGWVEAKILPAFGR
jgi:hypothetical protein